jgi:hypothetical protein
LAAPRRQPLLLPPRLLLLLLHAGLQQRSKLLRDLVGNALDASTCLYCCCYTCLWNICP